MENVRAPLTLLEAVQFFADPDRALRFMVDVRWPNGVTCPTCGASDVTFLKTRRLWKCRNTHPKRQFSVKVGTVMEDSAISLEKWLPAMWMIANCKNGISSYELARDLKVTQKTAWFMLHRIRLAMQEGSGKLGGHGHTVEVDETWIGGKARGLTKGIRRKRNQGHKQGPYKYSGKAIVLGMLQRGGRVRLRVVPDVRGGTLVPHIREHVAKGTEVHTDQHSGYESLNPHHRDNVQGGGFEHKVVNHAVEYVNGNVHTNNLENFWSLLKRGIRGTYVSVEPFHLFRYLDEQAFRFNERKDNDRGRFVRVAAAVFGRRLTYKQLTAVDALATT